MDWELVRIAELRFKILADLKGLQRDISKLFKEKFKIGVEGEGGGNKEDKKQTSLLGGILGKVLIIAAIVKSLQPILDILKFLLNLLFFSIAKIIKFLGEKIPAGLKNIKDFIADLPGKLSVAIFNMRDKVVGVMNSVKERIVELKNRFVSKIIELRDRFVASIKALPGRIKEFFVDLGAKIVTLKDRFVESIIALPGKIWDKIKQLASDIATELKKVLEGLNPVSKVKSFFGIDDAIITKDGKVIKTNPKDTIIATQNPGGVGGGITNNFFGVQPQDFIDEVKRQLSTDQIRSTRF